MRASVAPGYALADRIEALRGAVDEMNLPAAYTTTVSGRARELERTFTEFILGLHPLDHVHVYDSGLTV